MMQTEGQNIQAEVKYREAIALYSDSGLSITEICKQTGVGFTAFCTYLSKSRRDLILKRHNLEGVKKAKFRGAKGQTTEARNKYKDAILACDSVDYIEYNISQIARIFGVSPSSLLGQLRRHYPDVVARREKLRQQMGIAVNLQYGARQWTREAYTDAVSLLQTSDMTIEEVADACNVSYTGLREHITAYHPQITQQREAKRHQATGQKVRGQRNGSWAIHGPGCSSVEKYEQAIELYRTTSKDLKEIVRLCGVTLGGFRYYLRTWHPELMVHRRGFADTVSLEDTKRYKPFTAEKYADAIERLRSSDLPTAKVAAEFGLHPDVFRVYIKEHHPELATKRGMVKTAAGNTVSQRSAEKYAEALHLYATTSESLKSISGRLGLVYNSLSGFVRRNYPEMIQRHNSLPVSSDRNS